MELRSDKPVNENQRPRRLLKWSDLKARGWPFSRMHTDRLEGRGQFPQRVRCGERVVAWWEHEYEAHIAALPRGIDPTTTFTKRNGGTHE
jgi:predicted DNA-binding transcriptional regulator AlpA